MSRRQSWSATFALMQALIIHALVLRVWLLLNQRGQRTVRRLQAKVQAPIAPSPTGGRCHAIAANARQQHVCPVSRRSFPDTDRTAFRRASPGHVFGSCAAWPTLGEESSVIHRMPRRHAVGVALRHRLHGPTVVQWRQAVSMPEGIDRIGQRGRPAGRDGGKPKKYGENAIKRELHDLRPSLSCRR